MTDFLAAIWLAVIVSFTTYDCTSSLYKQELVERGYAVYCPNNGSWAFKGECE